MMEVKEITAYEESGAVLEERRGISPWLILGALLFVAAFVIGWRGAGARADQKPDGGT